MNEDALREASESGLFKEVLTIELAETPQAPVFVRPDAGEGEHEWTTRVLHLLAPGPGARVGVAADDPALAAAAAVLIAVSVADAGRRVVVVDGSLHAPAIAKALDGDGDEGLVDSVMFGVSTAVTARRTLAAGVSLMTSGSAPVSSEEVFRSDNFEATLRGFAQDVVVFVALPAAFLPAAAHALSDVVLLGRTTADLETVARSAADAQGPGASRTVGVIAARPRPPRPPGLTESFEAPEPPEPPRPEIAEPAPEPEAPREEPAAPAQAVPPQDAAPAYRRRSGVRTAYRTPAPVSERPTRRARPIVLAVLAIVLVAAVAGWRLGALNSLLVTMRPAPPVTGAERPASGSPAVATVPADTSATGTEGAGRAPSEPAAAGTTGAPAAGKPEPTPEAATQPLLRGPGGRYVVYVSSHRVETAAVTDAAALEDLGAASAVVMAEVGDSGVWYRVRVAGGYPTLEAAREALETVKGLAYDGAWIEKTPESQ